MPEIKRVTLHPLNEDGKPDLSINLYPKTLKDGIVDRLGAPCPILSARETTELVTERAAILDTRITNEVRVINTTISEEVARAESAEATLSNKIDEINSKIPEEASDTNKLADKEFVLSVVSKSDARFISPIFERFEDLPLVGVNNNDYAFVVTRDPNQLQADGVHKQVIKYTEYIWDENIQLENKWRAEYELYNNWFTTGQWAAINSGITSGKITSIDAILNHLESDKVDKVPGKELSANDFTDIYKMKVDDNTAARHSHNNKNLLDSYDQTNADISDAVAKKHTHNNKSILDATTAPYVLADQTKLNNIETNAEVNKIESIKLKDASTTTLTPDINRAVTIDISGKVDKVSGKQLSTNDFTNEYKAAVDANTIARHSHANKELLDTYDQTNIDITDAVNKKHTHVNKALLDTYTQTEADLSDAVSKRHEHANKALLDTYTQTEANLADAVLKKHDHSNKALLDTYAQTEANLADAVTKKHTHTNKAVLDGITAADISGWNAKYLKPASGIPAADLANGVVNDATITFYNDKTHTTIESFTLNQSSSETIHLNIPETAADIHALPDNTRYTSTFDLVLDPADSTNTTFKITLKDQNSEALATRSLGFPQIETNRLDIIAINGRIDDLDLDQVGAAGSYIKFISQVDGQVAAVKQAFDSSLETPSYDNAPNTKTVADAIDSVNTRINNLELLPELGEDGKYIKFISQDAGQVAARLNTFDTEITSSTTISHTNAPTSKATKTYVDNCINALDAIEVGQNGYYIKLISETNGIISATKQKFDTDWTNPTDDTAPTTKLVYDTFDALDLAEVGSAGGYIQKVSQVNGQVSATRQAFDTVVNSTTGANNNNAPTTKAIKDYVDAETTRAGNAETALGTRIDNLDLAQVGSDGNYIKLVSQADGQLSATKQVFDTEINNTTIASHINAPTTKAVAAYIGSLNKAEVGENGKYIKKIKENAGIITATLESYDTVVDSSSTNNNAPTSLAVKTYVDDAISSNTGAFLGNLDVHDDLGLNYGATTAAIATALNSYAFSPAPTNNDYCIIVNQDAYQNTVYQRFKYTVSNSVGSWAFEYAINNSSFNTAQWEAINSGIKADFIPNDVSSNNVLATESSITTAIAALDLSSVGADGNYIKYVSQADGVVSATKQAFDTTINGSSTDANAPTSKAVNTAITSAINALDMSSVGADGNYIKYVSQADGAVSATKQAFDQTLGGSSTHNNAPTSAAVVNYVDNYGGKIDSISLNGTALVIDEHKNVDLPAYPTKSSLGLDNVTNVSTTSYITSGSTSNVTSGAVYSALLQKADKVSGATANDLATLDSNGNLTDSGILKTSVVTKAMFTYSDGTLDILFS